MWDKFKAQFSAHPYLFGGVAVAILLWIFWPFGKSSGGSSDAAVQSAAIAQTAAANAQLMLASEETRRVGITASAAQAINEQNVAGTVQLANIESATRAYDADSAVKLATIQAGAQGNVLDTILKSQESAQKWAAQVEKDSGILPGNFEAFGFVNSGPAIVKIEPAPIRSSPIASSPFYGGSGSGGWIDTNNNGLGDYYDQNATGASSINQEAGGASGGK
ncbi:MAG: hypothetical protein AB7K41_14470 [Bdellovibrionales bacterium]